jgi:hypothetical protein
MAGKKKQPVKRPKPPKRQGQNTLATLRGCLGVFAELAGIAGFLLALYIFLKGG